jgi:hypothetical protein
VQIHPLLWVGIPSAAVLFFRSQAKPKGREAWVGKKRDEGNAKLFAEPATEKQPEDDRLRTERDLVEATPHGPFYVSYHTWLITPLGPKKCYVTFEEVASGDAARWAPGHYPEVVHISHDHWLREVKKVSEAHPEHHRSPSVALTSD